jgi:hypothetical protein
MEGGCDTDVGSSSSIKPDSRILTKKTIPAKAGGKMIILRYFYKLANIYFSSENLTNMTATLSKKFNDLRV